MALHVLHISFPFAPVTPDSAGGAEQVLRWLDRGLTRRGHRSIVVGPEGSRVYGDLIATPRVADGDAIDARAWIRAHEAYRATIASALRDRAIDVVHMHGIDFPNYLPDTPIPTVATLHLPIAWYDWRLMRPSRPHFALRCVSNAQRSTLAATTCSDDVDVDVISNGVPLGRREPTGRGRRRHSVLMLGRICPEKGVHFALDAARRARVPLTIAGRVFGFDAHHRYFRDTIAPRLAAEHRTLGSRFIGPVGPRRKRRLLRAARCLLVPSLASETSSLVSMEAMACGTPVIAFESGALPEIVDDGVTGFIVHSVEEMAEAIGAAASIDPAACRARAEARFSAGRMVDAYIRLYAALARA